MNFILIALTVIITVVSLFRLGYRIGHINGYDKGSRDVLRLYMETKQKMTQIIDLEERGWHDRDRNN